MQAIHLLPFSSALILVLSGCANHDGNDPLGTGPFDSAGNYHEEWANDPSKWSKPGKRTPQSRPGDDLPLIAKNDQPPPNANPLAPQKASHLKTGPVQVTPAPRESAWQAEESNTSVARTTPKSKPHVARTTTQSKTRVARTTHKSRPHVTQSSAKPKPQVAKTKSKSGRYTIKKGDSLSAIASRTGSSVSAIKKANGISGTLIHTGKTLVIPKR